MGRAIGDARGEWGVGECAGLDTSNYYGKLFQLYTDFPSLDDETIKKAMDENKNDLVKARDVLDVLQR